MCNLHWCYTFCTGVTLFALVLHLNCTALSQSESSNFFMCIISWCNVWHSVHFRYNISRISMDCDFISLLRDCFFNHLHLPLTVIPPGHSNSTCTGKNAVVTLFGTDFALVVSVLFLASQRDCFSEVETA